MHHFPSSAYLGGQGVWGSSFEQHCSCLHLALSGWNVEGSVTIGGSSIWMSHVLEQQLGDISFPQTGWYMQGSLVFLELKDKNIVLHVQSKKQGTVSFEKRKHITIRLWRLIFY